MRRLLLILAAVAGLTTAAAPTALAFARDGDQGRRAERQERGGAERGRRWDGERRGRGDERREWRGRGGDERRWRGDDRRAEDRRRFEDRRRDGDRGPPRAQREPRRGGYLPDGYRGGVVQDYPRYRLRSPPQGYAWVRVGNGFALVSLDDGRIYDMVQ